MKRSESMTAKLSDAAEAFGKQYAVKTLSGRRGAVINRVQSQQRLAALLSVAFTAGVMWSLKEGLYVDYSDENRR